MMWRGGAVLLVTLSLLGVLPGLDLGSATHSSLWDQPHQGHPQAVSSLIETTLPVPTAKAAGATGPPGAYVFGGNPLGAVLDTILRFDPANETVLDTGVHMPEGRMYSAAVYAAGAYYIIGGQGPDSMPTDTIYRFDPHTGTVDLLPTRLPQPIYAMAAVVVDDTIWIIGGRPNHTDGTDQILKFDVPTGQLTVHDKTLRDPLIHPSAAYHEGLIHVAAGGIPQIGQHYTELIDPVSGVVTAQSAVPNGAYAAHAIVSNGELYVVGGYNNMVQFIKGSWVRDAANARYLWTHDALPAGAHGAAVIQHGEVAYLLGGFTDGVVRTDNIIRFEGLAKPPVPDIVPVDPIECINDAGAAALDGRGSTDGNGDPLYYQWRASGASVDQPHSALTEATFPYGTTPVELTASDAIFRRTAYTDVNVIDTRDPIVRLTRPEPSSIYVHDTLDVGVPAVDVPTVVTGPLTVTAHASDVCKVVSVRFVLEGVGARTDSTRPYMHQFDPPVGLPGATKLTVIATDRAGNTDTETFEYLHYGTRTG